MNTRILRITSTIFALFFLLFVSNLGLAQTPKDSIVTVSPEKKDSQLAAPPSANAAGKKPSQGLTPEKADSLRPTYKILSEPQALFLPYYAVSNEARDHIYHCHVEDYFAENPNIFLRDKVELGQTNVLLVGGLGTRYQSILLDEVLLNDPISMAAIYQHLSSESFSTLNLHTGYTAFAYSSAPVTLQSATERFDAEKGYTKISFYQTSGNTIKSDIVFSLNLSKRLNFYIDYARESTDGSYANVGGSGKDFYGSSYEGNKFNIQFRYQLDAKSELTLAEYYNVLLSKPFGGVDYGTTISYGLDPFNTNSAIIQNQYTQRSLHMNVVRAEYRTVLPVFSDTSNAFKAWGYMATFSDEYNKESASLQDATTFKDNSASTRWSVGGSQFLNLPFLLLNLRGEYLYDLVRSQSVLVNKDSVSIKPTAHTIALNSGGKLKFDRLIFGRTLELGASLGLTTKSFQNTGGEDYTTTFVSTGFGGEMNFPLGFLGNESSLKLFATASTTQRTPSLQEVFSSDTLLLGSHQWKNETIQHLEFGAALLASENFSLRATIMHNRISSPIAIVRTVESDGSTTARFRSLGSDLSYSGLGISAFARLWKFDLGINTTAVLDYSLLSNPNRSYADTLASGSASTDSRTSKLLYLPKLYCAYELYYHEKLLKGALNLKVGFAGFLMTDMSASLQNRERENIFYFNLVEQNGQIRDNNLQYGAQGLKKRLDFRLWADVGSATITIFFENLLNEKVFKAPLYPLNQQTLRIGVAWKILN